MMLLTTHAELDEYAPGRFRHVQAMKPVAYRRGGSLRRIAANWAAGDVNFPHAVSEAGFLTYAAPNGDWRLCPTGNPTRWFSISMPFIKPNTTWTRPSLGTFSRSGNTLTATNANVITTVRHGGHFVKSSFELKNGWVPPNRQFAFGVGLNGLTRTGMVLYADGVPVMHLQAPVVYDAANPLDTRQIDHQLVQVGDNWYILFTLPSLAGMARPVIDPTLTLQPDAADGKDTNIFGFPNYQLWNDGVDTLLHIGTYPADINDDRRALIAFDLTTLPATAIITSAVLSLYCAADYSNNTRTVRVFRLKRAWIEGTRLVTNDTPATGATWIRYDLTNNWSTAGGFHANDCEQTDIGSRVMTATETLNEFKDFTLTPTTKAALDLGNGWLIKVDTESADLYTYASSDHATAAYRPKLVIDYTLPGAGLPLLLSYSGGLL